MNEELREKLGDGINLLLERLKNSEPGSKEESAIADSISKLWHAGSDEVRLALEEERLDLERERLDMERSRIELEENRNASNDIWNKAFGVGTELLKVGTFVGGQAFLNRRWIQGLQFEQTGTFGSTMVRSIVPKNQP